VVGGDLVSDFDRYLAVNIIGQGTVPGRVANVGTSDNYHLSSLLHIERSQNHSVIDMILGGKETSGKTAPRSRGSVSRPVRADAAAFPD